MNTLSKNARGASSTNILDKHIQATTLADILRWRASHQPDQRAYTFLKDGEIEGDSFTYAQLDREARRIATALRKQAEVGDRALLLYQPGLEYIAAFFGCLYAGVIAVPAYPPSSNRSFLRIQAIAADAQARIALTSSSLLSKTRSTQSLPATFQWMATNVLDEQAEEVGHSDTSTGEVLAFLQYTSGSTGTPKGVMVSHVNLMHNLSMMRERWGEQSVGVSWLPIFHDMGLIAGILLPLYSGFPAILMAPAAFMQQPLRWLQAISHYKGSISYAPNFAYRLCVDKFVAQEGEHLDLQSWVVAVNGAEPVRGETLERFVETFLPYGFRRETLMPGYGLAEATLMVSCTLPNVGARVVELDGAALERNIVVFDKRHSSSPQSLISCGPIAKDQRLVIVNPETHKKCDPGQVGEIWLSGPSVAQGYWQHAQETEQTFHAFLAESEEGPFLRTGDLGFVHNEELFLTGRLKDVIIIHGRNYYPQDIELTVEQAHRAARVGCGAAFSVEFEDEEHLVIVQELDRGYRDKSPKEVIRAICHAVWENHKLRAHTIVLIKHGSIPKTSSGKIQRHACRQEFLKKTLKVIEL